ncbi:distal-less homeobox 5, isoform CRA_b [Rattus norvegicus]|uniref:Distal-less homeobox 5, isoform CRA_b n=1 Tax=Rattus norvegicus TaxID=10116 RepID=A6IDV0_RAT|nr:distal-less homeobox 5, isoform CRA_b [Rattus norvegicus]
MPTLRPPTSPPRPATWRTRLPGTQVQPAQSIPTCHRLAPCSTRWHWPPGRFIRWATLSCSVLGLQCFAVLEIRKKGIHTGMFEQWKQRFMCKAFFLHVSYCISKDPAPFFTKRTLFCATVDTINGALKSMTSTFQKDFFQCYFNRVNKCR